MVIPVGVTLRPVPPALPRLGAGAGDGASQGGIRAFFLQTNLKMRTDGMLSATWNSGSLLLITEYQEGDD